MSKLHGLKRVREANALTQKEVAETAGLTNVTISLIENGQSARPSTVNKLAAALNVPLEELLYEEGIVAPLARGSVQRAAVTLALILERDAQKARHFQSDELYESVLTKACRAFFKLRERRMSKEEVPIEMEERFADIIKTCLDRPAKSEDDRADELLRAIELEPAK